ncbi:hypothetical protein STTU_1207 [Streptomyces sp. Tu6071]|nr:hypothetical protein STTU_1207 [Streptomyces sp. Tu6071]
MLAAPSGRSRSSVLDVLLVRPLLLAQLLHEVLCLVDARVDLRAVLAVRAGVDEVAGLLQAVRDLLAVLPGQFLGLLLEVLEIVEQPWHSGLLVVSAVGSRGRLAQGP